jgi:DNA polymerase III subunit gamma/tau
MSYVVLARKWRPQSFADLVGQGHVSRTLANAIASDRVAHAFLFTGVRGVGKTTSARILAKALNCDKGPTAEPCLTCGPCREIGDGVDVDVQEIDGASYTGVDAVRSLQETIPYQPARDRYKIYIVDEVHMLSTGAWNAFLKTLEEPPPHVKFIFATTEVNKVPVTILSRCQRYDFKLIGTEAIGGRLRFVLDEEKVEADDGAIHILAREAAGSMRDAMSMLDQVIAWGGTDERLTADGVSRVLGVAARSVLHQLGASLVKRDPASCLDVVASLAEQGFSLANVARDFLAHLRDLVVAKVGKEPDRLLDMADEERGDLLALAAESDADDLSRLYLGFSRAYDDIARSSQPRGAFEMALVRLARRPPLVPLDDLLQRLGALERRLAQGVGGGGGGTPSSSGSPSGRGPSGRVPSAPAGGHGMSVGPAPQVSPAPPQATPPAPAAPAPAAPAPAAPAPVAPAPVAPAPAAPAPAAPAPAAPAPAAPAPVAPAPAAPAPAAPAPAAPAPVAPAPAAPAPAAVAPANLGTSPPRDPAPAPAQATHREPRRPTNRNGWQPPAIPSLPKDRPAPRRPDPRTSGDKPSPEPVIVGAPNVDLGGASRQSPNARPQTADQLQAWEAILRSIREAKPALASVYEHAAPLTVTAEGVQLAYRKGAFLAEQAAASDAKAQLEAAVSAYFGCTVGVEVEQGPRYDEVESVSAKNAAALAKRIDQARQRVTEDPLVAAAMEHLGAELREVRLPADFA